MKNTYLLLFIALSFGNLPAYTPGGNPQYLRYVANNAGQSQGGYYLITTDMPLYEPSDKDSSIICKVDPASYYTPSELTARTPQNLKDILPLLKCSLDGTPCPSTSSTNCDITHSIAASCSYKNDTLIKVPGQGNTVDFYSSVNSEYNVTSQRGDPTLFYSSFFSSTLTTRPKTLILVPISASTSGLSLQQQEAGSSAAAARDPIIMVGRDKAGHFFTAAFLLKDNIEGGATNDAVYYPVDTTLDYNYITLGTTAAELKLEIKPIQKTIEGTTYTFDYAPVLTSGTQTTT